MRTGLLITGLLALALQGCGGGSTSNDASGTAKPSAGASPQQVAAAPAAGDATAATGTAKPGTATTSSPGTAKSVAQATSTFIPSAKAGRRGAVLLVAAAGPQTLGEAKELASMGVSAQIVSAGASLSTLKAALASLRARAQVDPRRVGIIGVGPGGVVAAKLIAAVPEVTTAALVNVGAAAAEPLSRAGTRSVLLQRSTDQTAMTEAVARRLVVNAPAGSMLHEFTTLNAAAQADRDRWVVQQLAS